MAYRRWLQASAGLTPAAALVANAARASLGSAGPSGADGSSVMSSGPLPFGGVGPSVSTPNLLSPEPAVDLRPERWIRVEPVRGTPEALIYGTLSGGPPCTVVGRVEVTETWDHLSVTLWVGRRPGAQCGGVQQQLGYPFVTRVRLAAPIGNRTVSDGAG